MRRVTIIASCLLALFGGFPSAGQVITPASTPPPCTGARCLNPQRGAVALGHRVPGGQRPNCPQGTVYNDRKGTCRVIPPG